MSRMDIVLIGVFASLLVSLAASKIKVGIGAGEDVHSEIFRLREDLAGVRNLLIIANGLLAGIIAALMF